MSMDPESPPGRDAPFKPKHYDDFWTHPSIESWWSDEVRTAIGAIDQKKAVILAGPHGIGKSRSFYPGLMGELSNRGYVVEGDVLWDKMRAAQLDSSPWNIFKQKILEGDDVSRKSWIDVNRSIERRRNPDAPVVFVLDEVGFEPENILRAREFFESQNIIPVFLHPMGYQEGRDEVDSWAKTQEGIEAIVVHEKLLPRDAVRDMLKAAKVDQAVLAHVDDP